MTVVRASYRCALQAFSTRTVLEKLIDAEVAEGTSRSRKRLMEIDEITGIVVDAAVKLHRDLGRDLFESVYEVALSAMLELASC